MKLFVVKFDEPKAFMDVKRAAFTGDKNAIVFVNEGSEGKSYELQSKKAAEAIIDTMGGELTVIEMNIRDILK